MTTPSENLAGDTGGDDRYAEVRRDRLTGCDLFESVAAELALGSLTGADRSAALAHLDGCEPCGTLLHELSAATDALLLAAPEADPPAGFEVRWLARIGSDTAAAAVPAPVEEGRRATVLPLRRRARSVFAAAAAAIVLAGAGVGVGVTVARQPSTATATGPIRLAALRSTASYDGGGPVGEVAITPGNPSWLVMTFQKPGWSGQVECVVTERGQSKQIGTFWLHDGTGSWAVLLPSAAGSVSTAQVRELTGSVLATASFTT
ncbi:MAG: hypothetical protein ABSE47_08685 [Acidimicrobiales bacterium]|jgi:hypothetical protein